MKFGFTGVEKNKQRKEENTMPLPQLSDALVFLLHHLWTSMRC